MSFKAFKEAASEPIFTEIVWPDSVPKDHPLRTLNLQLGYLPVMVEKKWWELRTTGATDAAGAPANMDAAVWFGKYMYTIIAASLFDKSGEPAFQDVWEEHCAGWTKQIDAHGKPITPPIDYWTLGPIIEEQITDRQTRTIMEELYDQVLKLNGFITSAQVTNGKN